MKIYKIFDSSLKTLMVCIASQAFSGEMPTGGTVKYGDVSIKGYNTNNLKIEQKTNKSVIDWDSFSIHSKGRVDFNMPSSHSHSLNRVNGSTPSSIAGKLNSNGKVILINPNGIAITPGAVINTNSFTASSLNIKDKDFLKDDFIFEGKGNGKIENKGKITIGGGGHAALLGGVVSNTGIVTAKLGKIFLGSGEKITLDFVGDGLMKITIPAFRLNGIKDIKGRSLRSIVSNSGSLKANGGLVQISASDARNLSRGFVNLKESSKIVAKTVNNKIGRVVIGGEDFQKIKLAGVVDTSANDLSKLNFKESSSINISGGELNIEGNIYADNLNRDKINVKARENLQISGIISSKGNTGGEINLISQRSIVKAPSSYLDVSGDFKGGRVNSIASVTNTSSGVINSSSDSGNGGEIDISGSKIVLNDSYLKSTGKKQGGVIRIGGELQGGLKNENNQNFYHKLISEKKNKNFTNAEELIVDKSSKIDVSSPNGKGGVAILWSDKSTKFSGSINAKGKNKLTKETYSNSQIQKELVSGPDPPILAQEWSKFNVKGKVNSTKNDLSLNTLNNPSTYFYDKGGGFVEISSKDRLNITNFKNIEVGDGTLLLDPRYIRIQSSDSDSYGVANGGLYSQNNAGTTFLTPNNITSLLNAGTDVTLQAHHTIFVDSTIDTNDSATSDLTLQAGYRVDIDANIDIADGDLTIMTNDLASNGVNTSYSSLEGTLIANGVTLTANNVTIDNMGRDTNVSTNSFLPSINASDKIIIRDNAVLSRGGTGITHRLYGNLSANGSGNAIEIISARLRRYNSSNLSAPNGRWLGWKSTSNENHLVQENNRQNADFKEFGKTYGSSPTPASGNGYLFSYNRDLTKTISTATKGYDGTTAITTATGLTYSSVNTYHNDTVSLDSPDATFDNKNAGSSKSITANSAFSATSSLTTGISGTGETNVFGYQVASGAQSNTNGIIARRSITLSGDRFYNGTNSVEASDLNEFTTLISGESLNVTGSGTVPRLVAGLGDQTVSLGSLVLQDNGSTLAANYLLSGATFEITQKPVTLTGSKIYNADNIVLASEITSISGTVGSETLSITGQGTTSNANVGSNLLVSNGTLALDDGIGAASNYIIGGNITFNINMC